MIFIETKLKGAFLIEPERRGDDRGYFARTFCAKEFEAHGLETKILQGNMSESVNVGTLRGMHFQRAPHQETKLVRCTQGALFDVIVDLRKDSETFCQWVGFELTPEKDNALFVPRGFAHGFVTLKPNTVAHYLVGAAYEPTAEASVRYNDPAFGIQWPVEITTISDKDANAKDFTPEQGM